MPSWTVLFRGATTEALVELLVTLEDLGYRKVTVS